MTCYHPLTAYIDLQEKTDNGKQKIVFGTPKGFDQYEEIRLPCGRCIGCRLERSRQWAVRCVHEALISKKACFITLTYNSGHLHPSGDLKFCKRDFVLFMKRLRKKFGSGIRFFHCGEYGSKFQRPHHHAIIFGLDFLDDLHKVPVKRTSLGHVLYRSEWLDSLWSDKFGSPIGFASVGTCTFESVAYVARYITKKINGDEAFDHYYGRCPEYITMSRDPGIGHDWALLYPEMYNYDQIVIKNGIKCKPPRYYDRIYDDIAPDLMEEVHEKRKYFLKKKIERKGVDSYERLEIKEAYRLLAAKKLVRTFENDS